MTEPVRVLIPAGALGLGFDAAALARGVARGPDIIAIDGGSTDSGPAYLGRGVSKYSAASTRAEWRAIILARAQAGCPLVIGTAGTCGAGTAVDWLVDITQSILAEEGLTARIAVLKSDQDAQTVIAGLASGRVTPLPGAPEVTDAIVTGCTNIVALAGAEQIAAALNTDAEIVIAGRTTDTAIIAALPLMRGLNAGAAWHGAKIGECGALCTTNPASGVIEVLFDDAGFTVTPMAQGADATPRTVAAHMLYENSDPFILYEPGGHLDVTRARYTAQDAATRVTGSVWVPSDRYTVKLEGARIAGWRTMSMATLRDPHYVAHAAHWADAIRAVHAGRVARHLGVDFHLDLRLIGTSATLGDLEPAESIPVEVGVMALVTAADQATATDVARLLNPLLLHHALTESEEMPTFAFPFSPAEVEMGPAYEFCLHHVMMLDDPMAAFDLRLLSAAEPRS